jgi:transcriptional regulator with XRE-family HTH domain
MSTENKGFNGDAFYRALESAVAARSKSWKQVAAETGVSASTLARMAQGRRPDAASLAALSAWAGLNPSDFVV